jgi:adenosylhomocysteine nucleosidase
MLCRLFLAVAALFVLAPPALAAGPLDTVPRTLVMTAYAPEWNALAPDIQNPVEHKINGMTYLTGTLEGKPVVLMMSGVSIVNAAMNTQIALDRFTVKRIVFSGVAGGVDPALNIGDVLIADTWGQYMEVSFARRTAKGYSPPEPVTPDAPRNWNFMFPRGVYVGNANEAPKRHFFFPVDPALYAVAARIAPTITLDRCVPASALANPGSETCLKKPAKVVIGGVGVTGPIYQDNPVIRQYLFREWKARILEMESAVVSQVAFANQVPAIHIRSLSDLAGGDPDKNASEVFEHLAAVNAARVLRAYLAALPD